MHQARMRNGARCEALARALHVHCRPAARTHSAPITREAHPTPLSEMSAACCHRRRVSAEPAPAVTREEPRLRQLPPQAHSRSRMERTATERLSRRATPSAKARTCFQLLLWSAYSNRRRPQCKHPAPRHHHQPPTKRARALRQTSPPPRARCRRRQARPRHQLPSPVTTGVYPTPMLPPSHLD